MSAYSDRTHRVYPSWDDLVSAEANGYIVTALVTNPKGRQWTYSKGPYPSKREATNARNRLRTEFKDAPTGYVVKYFVRPLWGDK